LIGSWPGRRGRLAGVRGRLALGLGALAAALSGTPAAALVCGETVEGTIAVLREVDVYTFQAAAGDVLSLTVGGELRFSAFGVMAEIRDPSNRNVTFRNLYFPDAYNYYCGPHVSCQTRALAVNGTYTLRVFDYAANATGAYSLTLETVGGTWNGGSNAPPSPVCGAVSDGTRTLACGETVSSTLDRYGDADTYTFYAAAGDVLALSISRPPTSTVNPVIELFAPGGAWVAFRDGGLYCEYLSCLTAPLPAGGVYTAKVTDSGITHLGAYSFTLDAVSGSFDGASNGPPAPACGGAPDGAQPLTCGQRVTGSIAHEGDSDAFTFLANAGEGVSVLLEQPAGSALEPAAELYTPSGELVAATSGPPDPSQPLASGPLPASGIYTLKLTDSEVLDHTGSYTLSLLSGRLAGASCAPGAPIRCGETLSGTLAAGGAARFHFAARAGDAVRIETAGSALPTLTLLAPDGSVASANVALAQSGVHTIVLASTAGGGYALTLETVSGSLNGGGNGWPPLVCGSDVPDGSRPIACGQTLSGAITVQGDSDSFTIHAEAGDVVTLGVNEGAAGFDPLALLFAPGGASVPLSGAGACGPDASCVSAPLPSTGAYTILVHEPGGAGPGGYSVTMSRSPCASDCQDGADNDGDGLVDRAADPGCASADDLSERRECDDGFDNDGDGLTDFAGGDVGCATLDSSVEDPFCDDGRDNDKDGGIDADGGGTDTPDARCNGLPSHGSETPPGGGSMGCGIGPELAALIPLLRALRRRARHAR
jgi:hypothetical protein